VFVLELDFAVDRRDLVVEVALRVRAGERVALFGPSGAGKTTILEAVAGLVAPRSGTVLLGGRTLSATEPHRRTVPVWQRRIGLLRQDPALFPHLSVRENLAYDRSGRGGNTRYVDELASRLDLDGLLDTAPAKLSGGQAQRVAIVRLLLADVDALLLDEPYAGLDAQLRRSVTDLVAERVEEHCLPAVLVAHELAEAQAFADRLGIIDRGRLLQLGTAHEVVARPASRRVAELVGYRAFVRSGDGATVVGVHPARVVPGRLPEAGTVLAGKVTGSRAAGARFEVDLDVAGDTVTCELSELPSSSRAEVTVLDPPVFSSIDGALSDRSAFSAGIDAAGSEDAFARPPTGGPS
jgi:ABC-type sulfate/molybdate transport systems ATPase subunit